MYIFIYWDKIIIKNFKISKLFVGTVTDLPSTIGKERALFLVLHFEKMVSLIVAYFSLQFFSFFANIHL